MGHLDLAQQVLIAARAASITIATAESCTAGLLAGALTDPAGASAVFEWGVIAYSNGAKQDLLGVKAATLVLFGAVSPQVACEMADGARARSGADLAVSVTGIAGPGGSEHKPEGRVCFALSQTGIKTTAETVEFGAIGRANVRAGAVARALQMLATRLS